MKISKIRPKFHFLTKIEIKMTPLLVLFYYSQHLLFLSHLEAVLSTFKILSCTNNECWNCKTNVKFEKRLLLFITQMSNLKYKCRIKKMLNGIKRTSKLKNKCSMEQNESQSWKTNVQLNKLNVKLEKQNKNVKSKKKNKRQPWETNGEIWKRMLTLKNTNVKS